MARPVVSVYNSTTAEVVSEVPLPAVFTAPIRPDVVNITHTNVAKNKRQAYAVSQMAGHQTSAESWGTGRAVSRIPRVAGGGTSRSGQGAFGNMCRGGRMFAPTKTWRRWNRKTNLTQRRHAMASALAATALTPLVLARGHRVEAVPQLPLVLSNDVQGVSKTKGALEVLSRFGAEADVEKAKDSKHLRRGKGKMRNRRYVLRRGPLVIYAKDDGITRAFRNLPGVELAHVDRLNLLQLAPGGHLGRFCVWTADALERLNALFGSYSQKSEVKTGYALPRPPMANADLARVINSDEIQSALKPAKKPSRFVARKRNPLRNRDAMMKLNPYFKVHRKQELKAQAARAKAREEQRDAARFQRSVKGAERTARKAAGKAFLATMMTE
eukprot:CAMPEP_0196769790 /NCGR_PEP_ID=MMETSP1104-20130614/752_1 /TAXON_ID=33652 /ORGANISM="Cafeteria sp., Strain Caron Lab Isolate" /LENGTH=383 /DNA_ID=CAMNT_0042139893 /DNA_START=35 /DNA_END=1186 /DNA_ORIENTATION=-